MSSASGYTQNDTQYTVFSGRCLLSEGIGPTTYGIGAVVSGIMVDSVADYDTDKTFVYRVVARLNAGKAQLCHFKEILEDELIAKSF
ncbi:MAG: hypothetical protein IKL92_02030 [Oscillospiraceae bacterium]|nr:hypothetical protein [Oscillospiraceae bacterium]